MCVRIIEVFYVVGEGQRGAGNRDWLNPLLHFQKYEDYNLLNC